MYCGRRREENQHARARLCILLFWVGDCFGYVEMSCVMANCDCQYFVLYHNNNNKKAAEKNAKVGRWGVSCHDQNKHNFF